MKFQMEVKKMNKKSKFVTYIISLIISVLIYFLLGKFITDTKAMIGTSVACFLVLIVLTESIWFIINRKKMAENVYALALSSIFLVIVILFTLNVYIKELSITLAFMIFVIALFLLFLLKDIIYKTLLKIFKS